MIGLGGCSDSEPSILGEDRLHGTIECLLQQHDETMIQMLAFLEHGTPDAIEEARRLATISSDFIREYCGLAP